MMKKYNYSIMLITIMAVMLLFGCSSTETPNNDSLLDDNLDDHQSSVIPEEDVTDKNEGQALTLEKEKLVIEYLNMIYKENLSRINYSAYSGITNSYNFIYFYSGNDKNINQKLINLSLKKTRPGTIKSSTDWIVIHDTGNNASTATAKAHVNYLNSNPGVSWHYSVDQNEIYQHLPNNEIGYHAGDGTRPTGTSWYNTAYTKWNNGGGNANGIGIEMAVNSGSDYNQTIMNTASLVADLLIKYDLSLNSVKRHYDFSGKSCPQALISSKQWENFVEKVNIALYYKKNLNDVKITFVPLTNNISKTGLIDYNQSKGSTVKYKVIVENKGITKEFVYSTTLI